MARLVIVALICKPGRVAGILRRDHGWVNIRVAAGLIERARRRSAHADGARTRRAARIVTPGRGAPTPPTPQNYTYTASPNFSGKFYRRQIPQTPSGYRAVHTTDLTFSTIIFKSTLLFLMSRGILCLVNIELNKKRRIKKQMLLGAPDEELTPMLGKSRMSKPVREVFDKCRKELVAQFKMADLTPENVIKGIQEIREAAFEAGDFGTAKGCEELKGKHLAMFVERRDDRVIHSTEDIDIIRALRIKYRTENQIAEDVPILLS